MLFCSCFSGYIAWQGCIAAIDSHTFCEKFDQILAKVLTDTEETQDIKTGEIGRPFAHISYDLGQNPGLLPHLHVFIFWCSFFFFFFL